MSARKAFPLSLDQIRKARERIAGAIISTPCVPAPTISEKVGRSVYLKLECLQITGAFKARGNANKILLLSSEEKKRGVITASSGNHGQGLSLSARRSGVSAVVVVPETAPKNKIEKIRGYGARVIINGVTYDDASSLAHDIAEKEGMVYVPSFDDPDIVAGNASIGLEIIESVPETEAILCPIGGGGGISGVALAAKQMKPAIEIYGVEAEEAASMQASLCAGMPVELASASTVADGIAVCRPGDFNFRVVREFVDGVLTVSDAEIFAAVAVLVKEVKIVAECAGAATVAALLAGKLETEARTVVCIISGGNIDTSLLCSILQNADEQ